MKYFKHKPVGLQLGKSLWKKTHKYKAHIQASHLQFLMMFPEQKVGVGVGLDPRSQFMKPTTQPCRKALNNKDNSIQLGQLDSATRITENNSFNNRS